MIPSIPPSIRQPQESDIDPTTGFISYDRIDAFSVTKKVEFLRLYRQNLNMTKSAELVGSMRQTVMDHMGRDKAFAQAVMQAKLSISDRLAETALDVALKPEGVRDRWSIMERANPDEWGRKEQISQTEIKISLDVKEIDSLKAHMQAIDAEIVGNTVDRKQITDEPRS